MKCQGCGFDLPGDFPTVALNTPDGRTTQVHLCVPCSRLQKHAVIRSAEGYKRIGAMTR